MSDVRDKLQARLLAQQRGERLEAEIRRLRDQLTAAEDIKSLAERWSPQNLRVPSWTIPQRTSGKRHRGIAVLHLTDTHFDEVVEPAAVDGFNAYNREIAVGRLRRLAAKTIEIGQRYIAGIGYDGLVIMATGDIFSGDIHEELRRTNEDTLYASCRFWVGQMVAFLRLLADAYRKVHVVTVVGNHGRNSRRPIYKKRAQNNIEWLFWHWVADSLADDARITFVIPDAFATSTRIYSTVYVLEHGDEFKGGTGISGARAPLLLGQHRLSVQRLAMGRPFNWLVVGHFHQYSPGAHGVITGGSLKGYDEYAMGLHLRPEPPTQGFWVETPERGPTLFAPLYPGDRKAEGW